MTVKMPLLRSFLRSFSLMPDSRLRSSFSIAFCRQRAWNSHSAQCRFRTRSGGVGLESSAAIFSTRFRTSPTRAEVFTFSAAVVVAVDDLAEADLASQSSRRTRTHRRPAAICHPC